jgi:hypothetical protein
MRAGRRLVLILAFAGGFALVGSKQHARAGEPLDDRLGVRTAPLFLLLRADIQKELGLAPPEIAEVKRVAESLYVKALDLKGKTGPGVEAARRALNGEGSNWISAHLKPEQRERLGQIELQWEGATALLNRPIVAEYLGMTSDQQDQLARVCGEAKKERVRQGPWTYEEHLELTRKTIAVLSEKQRHLWAKVLGRPCRFAIPAAHAFPGPQSGGEQPGAPATQR